MAAKDVKFSGDARERLLRGVETLANAVRGAQEAGRKYINVASQLLADVRG